MKHARRDYDRFQDPVGKIPADEPVFLLRGQDALAWQAVALYGALVEAHGGDPVIVALAREHAAAMRDWRPQKAPDVRGPQLEGEP